MRRPRGGQAVEPTGQKLTSALGLQGSSEAGQALVQRKVPVFNAGDAVRGA